MISRSLCGLLVLLCSVGCGVDASTAAPLVSPMPGRTDPVPVADAGAPGTAPPVADAGAPETAPPVADAQAAELAPPVADAGPETAAPVADAGAPELAAPPSPDAGADATSPGGPLPECPPNTGRVIVCGIGATRGTCSIQLGPSCPVSACFIRDDVDWHFVCVDACP